MAVITAINTRVARLTLSILPPLLLLTVTHAIKRFVHYARTTRRFTGK